MASNEGKYLEDAVEKYFAAIKKTDTICTRLPDSRAARNMIKAQNADFLISTARTGAFHLECKSIGGKVPRLKKFRQFATMYRWALAGTPGYVLCHFYDLQIYKVVKVAELDPMARSWAFSCGWEVSFPNVMEDLSGKHI